MFADATIKDRAGIVDEHFDMAKVFLSSPHHPGGLFGIADIRGKHKSRGAEPRGSLGKIRCSPPGKYQAEALLR
jgi:hypothetical protein